MACVDLLVAMGLRPENVTLTDIKGVVHAGRDDLTDRMRRYAQRHRRARWTRCCRGPTCSWACPRRAC